MTSRIDPIAVALSVARTLDALGIAHTIGGSIASSFAGSRARRSRDVLGIVRVQGPKMDREYLRQSAPILGVQDLLNRALTEGS